MVRSNTLKEVDGIPHFSATKHCAPWPFRESRRTRWQRHIRSRRQRRLRSQYAGHLCLDTALTWDQRYSRKSIVEVVYAWKELMSDTEVASNGVYLGIQWDKPGRRRKISQIEEPNTCRCTERWAL